MFYEEALDGGCLHCRLPRMPLWLCLCQQDSYATTQLTLNATNYIQLGFPYDQNVEKMLKKKTKFTSSSATQLVVFQSHGGRGIFPNIGYNFKQRRLNRQGKVGEVKGFLDAPPYLISTLGELLGTVLR